MHSLTLTVRVSYELDGAGTPNDSAVVYALPFQQTCPKIDLIRLPDAGCALRNFGSVLKVVLIRILIECRNDRFWASFWRLFFRVLSVELQPGEQEGGAAHFHPHH